MIEGLKRPYSSVLHRISLIEARLKCVNKGKRSHRMSIKDSRFQSKTFIENTNLTRIKAFVKNTFIIKGIAVNNRA